MEFYFTPITGYSIIIIGILLLLILYLSICIIYRWIALQISNTILKYLVYTTISFFGLFNQKPLVKDVILTIIFISANTICVRWNIKSKYELSVRCASMLVTNLIILLPSASTLADILQISRRNYQRAHSIIGLVALIEGSIHAILELVRHNWNSSIINITGLVVRIFYSFLFLANTIRGSCALY
jgi:hypothetical protein